MRKTDAAWLAGMWDGEGSVGIAFCHKAGRKRPYTLTAALQLNMTCVKTVQKIVDLLFSAGIKSPYYLYQEKDPEKHRDVHILKVSRILDQKKMCDLVSPYAVTKAEHWGYLDTFVSSRLTGAQIDADGKIVRGGTRNQRGFSEIEIEAALALRELNKRGPKHTRKKDPAWIQALRG